MKKIDVRSLVIAAILTALVVVSIIFIHIPTIGQQFMHIADSFILLSALLGPFYGFLVGGIGAFLADFLVGAGVYAPWSLIIHGLQAVLMALVIVRVKDLNWIKFFIIGAIISFVTVVFGYAIVEYLLSGGQIVAALASMPLNTVQILVGSALGALLFQPFKKLLSLKSSEN